MFLMGTPGDGRLRAAGYQNAVRSKAHVRKHWRGRSRLRGSDAGFDWRTARKNPQTLAIRWTGYSNFELVYNHQIILLDAYFDRGARFPPLGFRAADVKRADLILIGHGHLDHMSDAASVGSRTGALVVGAPVTTEKLRTQAIDPKQIRTVTGRGGELLTFTGFIVEPILGRHGEPPKDVTAAFEDVLKRFARPATPEQAKEREAIRARGTNDPRVVTEGTIAYLITLDNGFRIMYRDSGGRVTEYERAAMDRVGRVDVAIVAVSASFLNTLTIEQASSTCARTNPTCTSRRTTTRTSTVCGGRQNRYFRR